MTPIRWALWLAPFTMLAQQPRLQNAMLETRAAAPSLDAVFQPLVQSQPGPLWIGYAIPLVPGERQSCCFNGDGGSRYGCGLEGRPDVQVTPDANLPVPLEGPSHLFVFFRIAERRVDRVRTFTPECPIDAGGLRFHWLTDVKPPESVAQLERLVQEPGSRRGNLISTIALTRDASADAALDRLLAPSQEENTRRDAAFWQGNARGRPGYERLLRVLRDDPSDRVREHVVLALSQSREREALTVVVQAASQDKSPRVRGQALFWLAQRASREISQKSIRAAIENDPDTEVKRRALSALTQIPNQEGVPLLMEVARNNRNPAIRKQAMSLLGQSKDPRALKFFEEVLTVK